MLCIPEHLSLELKLQTESLREVTVANGRSMTVPYVGPVKVAFGDRLCFVGALVLGEDVLLGAVPMEDMDLTINPPAVSKLNRIRAVPTSPTRW